MRAQGDIYVFTGPVYYGKVQIIGPRRVWVPTALFKLVYDPAEERLGHTGWKTQTTPRS